MLAKIPLHSIALGYFTGSICKVSSAKGLDSGRRSHRVKPPCRPISAELECRHHPNVRSRCFRLAYVGAQLGGPVDPNRDLWLNRV